MKIVGKDNREYLSDFLVAEKVNSYLGSKIVDFLNEKESDTYYVLVEDDYKLYDHTVLY